MNSAEKAAMAEQNMALVWHAAHKFNRTTGIELEELFSLALLGMARALARFDTARNVRFSTFAMRCMEREILMELRRKKRRVCTVSLCAPISDKHTLEDLLPADTDIETDTVEQIDLRRALTTLTERERELLILDTNGVRQADLGKRFGVSQSYVSRLIAGAQRKARKELL